MKQSPTMSKVLIVFLLASWNFSLPGSTDLVFVPALFVEPLPLSELSIVDLGVIKSVLILLVRTQTILP